MDLVAAAVDDVAILGRLLVALVLSAMMGWERERQNRAAGLRTHMLVGMSAAMFVSLGAPMVELYERIATSPWDQSLRFDPLRIIEAVVAGVSFLGAGTIFVARKQHVRGLTTAASILATAAVGMSVGLARSVLAFGTSVLIVIVLGILSKLELSSEKVEEEVEE
jgi:putative Mg2+ transporter-C (MgtC) family protein